MMNRIQIPRSFRPSRGWTALILLVFLVVTGCSQLRQQRKKSKIVDDPDRQSEQLVLKVNGDHARWGEFDKKAKPAPGRAKFTVKSVAGSPTSGLKIDLSSELQCKNITVIPRHKVTKVTNKAVCGIPCLTGFLAVVGGGIWGAYGYGSYAAMPEASPAASSGELRGDDKIVEQLYYPGALLGTGALMFGAMMVASIDTTEHNPSKSRIEVGDFAPCVSQDTSVSVQAQAGEGGEVQKTWNLELTDNAIVLDGESALAGLTNIEKKFKSSGRSKKTRKGRKRFRRRSRFSRRGKRRGKKAEIEKKSPLQVSALFGAPWTCVLKRDVGDSMFTLSWDLTGVTNDGVYLTDEGQKLCFDWNRQPDTKERVARLRGSMLSQLDDAGFLKAVPQLIKLLKNAPESGGNKRYATAADVATSLRTYIDGAYSRLKVPDDNGYPGEGALRALTWEKALKQKSIDGYTAFFTHFGDEQSGAFRRAADKAFWAKTRKKNSVSDYTHYLATVKEGAYIKKANASLSKAFIKAKDFKGFFDTFGKDHRDTKKARSAFARYVKAESKKGVRKKDTGVLTGMIGEVSSVLGDDDRQAKSLTKTLNATLASLEKKLEREAKAKKEKTIRTCIKKLKRVRLQRCNSRFDAYCDRRVGVNRCNNRVPKCRCCKWTNKQIRQMCTGGKSSVRGGSKKKFRSRGRSRRRSGGGDACSICRSRWRSQCRGLPGCVSTNCAVYCN